METKDCLSPIMQELESLNKSTDQDTPVPSVSLKPQRVKDIIKELEALKKYTRNLDLETQKKVFDEFYTDFRTNALNGINNKISMANIKQRVMDKLNYKEFGGDGVKVMRDHMSQTERLIKVYNQDNLSILVHGLDEIGATSQLKDAKFLDDVVNEISHSGAEGKPGITGNKLAQDAAKVFKKVSDSIHDTGKKLGLDWKYIDNYMPTIWDSKKFGLVDEAELIQDFMGNLNMRAYPGRSTEDLKLMFKDFYRDISMADYDAILELPDSTFVQRRKDSMAKSLLRKRAIHLTPEGQFALWKKYGADDFMGNFERYSKSVAKKFALIENFGATPSIGFDQIFNEMASRVKDSEGFAAKKTDLDDQFKRITDPYRWGKGNTKYEKFGDNTRGIVAATSLSVKSSVTALFTDPAMYAGWALSRSNVDIFRGITSYYQNMFKVLSKEDRIKYGKALGVVFGHERDLHLEKLGMQKGPTTTTSKVINTALKWTGLPFQQGISQESALLAAAFELSEHTGKSWSELDTVLKTTLSREGMTPEHWDIVRTNLWGDEQIVSPEAIRANKDLGDIAIDAAHSLKKYLYNLESGVVVPGSRETNVFNNMSANTVRGQVWRSVGMFKTYPMAAWNKMMLIHDYNPANASFLGMKTKGNASAVAQTMIGLMTMTYIGNILKDLSLGKEPAAFHPTDVSQYPQLLLDSGAGGLYADSILTNYEKYAGISLPAKVAGPVFSKAGDAYEAVQNLADKDMSKKKKGMDMLKLLSKNIPLNVPVIKPMLDFAILNALRSEIDPSWKNKRLKALNTEDVFGNKHKYKYVVPAVNQQMFDLPWR